MSRLAVVATVLIAALGGCAASPRSQDALRDVLELRAEIVETLSHDAEAFTQGLSVVNDTVYESTGLVGKSSIRKGPLGQSPDTRLDLASPLFGEGIAVNGASLWQLTWKNGVAIERDSVTLAERRRVNYSGEGWGLCYDEPRHRLVMSNGSDTLTFRDPTTFAEIGHVTVRANNASISQLNELECVGNDVYANVLNEDYLIRIDINSGNVTARIDASGLLSQEERSQADVLNGVAYLPQRDQFLLTGKLWPKMFLVKLSAIS